MFFGKPRSGERCAVKLKTLINQLEMWRKSYLSRTGEEATILSVITDLTAIKFIIGAPREKKPKAKRDFK